MKLCCSQCEISLELLKMLWGSGGEREGLSDCCSFFFDTYVKPLEIMGCDAVSYSELCYTV